MGKINPSTDSPALRIPTDVAEQMSKRGHDVSAFEARLSATPRPEAERTWANIIDYYRHSTQASNVVGSVQSQLSPYRQNRLAETANPNWTAWDDMGSQFKNQFNYLAQGVANFVPSTVDLAMSVASNPSDESWYRKWQDNVNQYFDKYKYYTSPEAEAAVYDSEKGLNWRAVAGMTGSTLGFLASSVIPAVGAAGRVGAGVQATSTLARTLSNPTLQAAAIGYLQTLPQYQQEAMKAGYSRNQAAIIAPILATAQAALEAGGQKVLENVLRLGSKESSVVIRQLSDASIKEAFAELAGKPITEATLREVTDAVGKNFFQRFATAEGRKAILDAAKRGALEEGGEEVIQTLAEKGIQKFSDSYYGYAEPGGKGFDPTWKETGIESLVGLVMGGATGASFGSVFGGDIPTRFADQTLFGKLNTDLSQFYQKNPGASLLTAPADGADPRSGIGTYKQLNALRSSGALDETQYTSALDKLDRMAGVIERLKDTGIASPATRYALFDITERQSLFDGYRQSQIEQPLARLRELSNEVSPGVFVPKSTTRSLDLVEAKRLSGQRLPERQGLAAQYEAKMDEYLTSLADPNTERQALASYRTELDNLREQIEDSARPKQTKFTEDELAGLSRVIPGQNGGFFVLRGTDSGPEVLRASVDTEGARGNLEEDRDQDIGTFNAYQLPTKGRPVVRFDAITDIEQQNRLLNAFDRNPQSALPYAVWRTDLDTQYRDDTEGSLLLAREQWREERDNLLNQEQTDPWSRQDNDRKGAWLQQNLRQLAQSGDTRYNWLDYLGDYHPDFVGQHGLTPETMDALDGNQATLAGLLDSGDSQAASDLLTQLETTPTDDTSATTDLNTALSAELGTAAERNAALQHEQATGSQLPRIDAAIAAVEQLIEQPEAAKSDIQRVIGQIDGAIQSQSNYTDALGESDSKQSGNPDTADPGDATPAEQTSSVSEPDPAGVSGGPIPDAVAPDEEPGGPTANPAGAEGDLVTPDDSGQPVDESSESAPVRENQTDQIIEQPAPDTSPVPTYSKGQRMTVWLMGKKRPATVYSVNGNRVMVDIDPWLVVYTALELQQATVSEATSVNPFGIPDTSVSRAVKKWGLPQQYGAEYIARINTLLSNAGIAGSESQALVQRLTETPLSYPELADVFSINPNSVAGAEDMGWLMDRNNEKLLPSIINAATEVNTQADLSTGEADTYITALVDNNIITLDCQ